MKLELQDWGALERMGEPNSRPGIRPAGRVSYESSSSFRARYQNGQPVCRRDSVVSSTSHLSEVEMAQEEVFAGPMSESIPSSVTGFAHHRERAESTTSFTFYPDDAESPESVTPWPDNEAVAVEDGDERDALDDILESPTPRSVSPPRRKSSSFSRISVEDPLLRLHSVSKTAHSGFNEDARCVQRFYIATEDLTVVFAGFRTNRLRFILYVTLCFVSLGLVYLLLRWIPSWKVRLIGMATPLRDCQWVVIENQWAEFNVHSVQVRQYGHSFSTVFGSVEKELIPAYEEDDDPTIESLRYFDYRYIRFTYHPLKDRFVMNSNFRDSSWEKIRSLKEGLDNEDRLQREQVFGPNLIDIDQKSVGQLLFQEVLHPFYVFQIASLILWSMDEYYYYASCIFVISVISITTTLLETRATMRRLREISRFECDIRVLRNGFWRTVQSSELVPGDVYELSDPSLALLPCDSLLLAGDCVVNESMLTGESVPVSKTPATEDVMDLLDITATSVHPSVAKHFLFCGTKIIRVRKPQGNADEDAVALAVALRTGFNTTKGSLVRSMMFPKPSGFKFYRDSFRYISVMAGIAAVGFMASFLNFARLHLAWHLVIIRALDLITIVVPPALPATLSIGINFALSRLKQKRVFCISPQRINVGGKLDIICFDKTGTLTEEGLDVLGIRVASNDSGRFSDLHSDVSALLPGAVFERDPTSNYGFHKAILHLMTTCHSLKLVGNGLIGDPLDLKMFEFTEWSLEESPLDAALAAENSHQMLPEMIVRPPPGMEFEVGTIDEEEPRTPTELGVWKSFEFVTQLRRASVLVQQNGSSEVNVYVKGAPECMREICRHESFPPDYEDLLNYYTHRGFRVIACATKLIARPNWARLQKMSRQEAESDLDFIGFVIFENKLKDATTDIIDELNEANIRSVMCTGDNILTAISVARECHLVDRTAHCFVPFFIEGDAFDPEARLKWRSIDNPVYELDDHTLLPTLPADADTSLPYEMLNLRNFSIAISGDAFRWIVEHSSSDVLKQMLARAQVFARMSPDEKHELVEKFQSIDYCCGFCGDGANDCGALKAADVGISLSEAEASVAAPFTSRVFDISCVPEVIREGRAALVTSFSCFKYMSLYSAIQFTSVSLLYASVSNLGDFQFLYIDLILILPIAIFMGWTGAFPVLSRKRPTASLVSRKVLVPLLGQMLLCILIQVVAFEAIKQQTWYEPPLFDKDRAGPNTTNFQNTTLFLISSFQYILSSLILSKGPPFRKTMAENRENLPRICSSKLTFHPSALRHDCCSYNTLLCLSSLRPFAGPCKVHGSCMAFCAVQVLHSRSRSWWSCLLICWRAVRL